MGNPFDSVVAQIESLAIAGQLALPATDMYGVARMVTLRRFSPVHFRFVETHGAGVRESVMYNSATVMAAVLTGNEYAYAFQPETVAGPSRDLCTALVSARMSVPQTPARQFS